jgi:hypothetical protein
VEVVEEQHDGLALGGVLQEGPYRVEEAEASLRRVFDVWGGLQVREARAHVGDDLGDVGSASPHLSPERLCVVGLHIGAQGLHPGPEWRGAGLLGTTPPQHLGPALRRMHRELLGGARLADAGLAHQHHQPTPAGQHAL